MPGDANLGGMTATNVLIASNIKKIQPYQEIRAKSDLHLLFDGMRRRLVCTQHKNSLKWIILRHVMTSRHVGYILSWTPYSFYHNFNIFCVMDWKLTKPFSFIRACINWQVNYFTGPRFTLSGLLLVLTVTVHCIL